MNRRAALLGTSMGLFATPKATHLQRLQQGREVDPKSPEGQAALAAIVKAGGAVQPRE